jgi:hypothetical protein
MVGNLKKIGMKANFLAISDETGKKYVNHFPDLDYRKIFSDAILTLNKILKGHPHKG